MRSPTRRTLRPEDARRSNLALVLQAILVDPQLSRADIARSTGLTKVTVSDLVAELIADGLVQESGPSDQTRPGKRGTLLTVNQSGRDIVALDVSAPDTIRGAIVSLTGEIRDVVVRDLGGAVGDDAVTAVRELSADLVAACSHRVLGVAVGTPGTVAALGTVLSAPNLQWRDLPLRALLADDLQIPVRVENDANVAVLAERRFAGGPDNLVRIHLSRGVGAGLLVDGRLVHGVANDAGEIGHVVVDENGPLCRCGKYGCLEMWTSVPSLRARLGADPDGRDRVLGEAGVWLGSVLSPIVAMLGLQHVVIGGPADLVTAPLLDATRRCIQDRTRSAFRPDLEITPSTLGEDAVLLGAAALILLDQLGVA